MSTWDYPSYHPSPPHSQSPPGGVNGSSLELGLVLGRMLAAQDKQIMLLERIESRLQSMPVALAERLPAAQPREKMSWQEIMLNIRHTAYALLPIAVLALVIAGKISVLEGFSVIRQLILGPAAGS